jgi:hypothetical protein
MRSGKGNAEKVPCWQGTMGEAARSEMSIRESCRRRRLRKSQFSWWRRHLEPGRQFLYAEHLWGVRTGPAGAELVEIKGGGVGRAVGRVTLGRRVKGRG